VAVYSTSNTITISNSTITMDFYYGAVFSLRLSSTVNSVVFANVASSGNVVTGILYANAAGTAYNVTWPVSVRWPGAITPILTTANNKVDILSFTTFDGGTNWFATIVSQNS
jgi:hypothetical protein